LVRSIAAELLVGVSIGLFGRLFFMALETMAAAIAMSVGLSANLGTPVETEEPLPALASFVTLSATVLLFATDLHWEVVRGLVASYDAIPVRDGFRAQASLVRLTDLASQAFVAALRIAGPFIVFALVLNLAFGLLNKLTPQVPVYFVAAPVVLLGGIGLLYFAVKPALQIFIQAFTLWITRGERWKAVRNGWRASPGSSASVKHLSRRSGPRLKPKRGGSKTSAGCFSKPLTRASPRTGSTSICWPAE
jgi:flagellar biosynthesis protein FliR